MLDQTSIDKLETPCIVIEVDKVKENLKYMQTVADRYHCKLRPHIKTHKMKLFAQMQIAQGCHGITCAKISEAEVMAAGGIEDIFIAYPMVGDFRIQRAITLAKKIKRLILAVDSFACAERLNDCAKEQDIVLEVRMEVDTGVKRTGVLLGQAVALSKEIVKLSNLHLTGIYTFKGLTYHNAPTTDNALASQEEGEIMESIANEIRSCGIALEDVSAGSSPTGEGVASTGKVTEIRPGTYIFKDYMLYKEGVAKLSEISGHFYATVVSTPAEEYAVIDGGTKTFPSDISLHTPPYYFDAYAVVDGDDNLMLSRMNEEHGVILAKNKKTGLQVGQKIKLIPLHICTAINLQNEVYLYEDKTLRKQRVDARGMLV